MILLLLLALAPAVAMVESADDRIFRLGEETHVLQMRLHNEFLDNPANRARLAGDNFARTCTAHFLAFLKVEPRYASEFRPIVIASMRAVVPADRLAAARFPLGHDPALLAWHNRVHDEIAKRGAALLAKAAADYDREFAAELEQVEDVALPRPENIDRSRMDGPQLGISCFIYFGNHREEILAIDKAGVNR